MNKSTINGILKINSIFLRQNIRLASNVHYYKKINKTDATDLALKHYDNFYSKVYDKKWQSIRLGLLSPSKYAAIVNSFCDKEEIEIQMRQLGAYDLRYIYDKNSKRIKRHREKLDVFKQRKLEADLLELENSDGQDTDVNGTSSTDDEILKQIECAPSSESEFEDIGQFLTEESETGEIFQNAATRDIDLTSFVPVNELKYDEEIVNDMDYFQFYELNSEVDNLQRTDQKVIQIPEELSLFTFGRNEFEAYPAPKPMGNLMSYYLLDAASVLPVLLLDIQDGDTVADFCAAPGGKSILMAMQRKQNCRFLLNDSSASRYLRLKNVFHSFIPKKEQANITFHQSDAASINAHSTFDKILVDAPCTNDRHSLYVADNNIFAPKRIQERVDMPTKQMKILMNALRCVKPGGTVVYSTCSLSPIQNDGVVHQALKQLSDHLQFTVVNPKEALRPLRGIFEMNHKFKYGTQVLPYLPSNFGPMYFAKIVRNV